MSFTVDPQTYLDAISTYVSAQANVPTSATWETYSEPNSEVVSFRLADRIKVPFVGYVVTMDAAEVALTSKASIAQLVGDLFIEVLNQGLPEKTPGQPYPGMLLLQ